ncbi:MAG: T9SS type A sorting domain-containing protein, partial [Bacteroidota bacterium]
YWIEEFDIDGYRIDAVWAPHARNPTYMHEWRLAVKRVKPEVLLLAEDKAARSDALPNDFPSTFENFDLAYDWSALDWCISHWSWAYPGDCNYYPYAYGNMNPKYTIFNRGNDGIKAANLRRALSNGGDGYHPDARIFRYIENNDSPRFIAHHTPAQTRMAAALLFALDGVPMLYYGQETGAGSNYPTIPSSRSLRSLDSDGWWPFYQHLIGLRHAFPSLRSINFEEVDVVEEVPRGRTYAFRRWLDDENVFAAVNLGALDVSATLAVPVDRLSLEEDRSYYLTDLLTGDHVETDAASLASLEIDLPPHTAVLYALADSVIHVAVSREPMLADLPESLTLHQNYPNPFNPQTTIAFEVPATGHVSLDVFDLLGRRVVSLVSGEMAAGRHEVHFDAGELASGTYLYRISYGGRVETKRMMLIR